jgi:hypothetical protein
LSIRGTRARSWGPPRPPTDTLSREP